MSEQGGLVPSEGVDEASADSTGEGPGSGARGADVLGEPPHGAPADETQVAGPVDMESEQSRGARDRQGAGQQLEAGEG